MGRGRSGRDQWAWALLGALMLALGCGGFVHAARATVAAVRYQSAKYGVPRPAPERVLNLCRTAYAWYPWNYYFSIEAAEQAYRESERLSTNAVAWREQAKWWCGRGLAQNPYKSQLRRLQTRFLWEESPSQAIAYWTAYTDWHYWEPYNHTVLAELHAAAGEFEEAGRELELIRGFPDHADAAAAVARERQTWDALLKDSGPVANDPEMSSGR